MRYLRDRSAFTLIELLVIMVILGILAAVAVPLYTGYIKEGRRAEARGGIAAILTAEQRYYRDPGNPKPEQYTENLGDLGVDLTEPGVHWGFTLSGASGTGFTCKATGKSGTDYAGLWVQLIYSRGAEPQWTTD